MKLFKPKLSTILYPLSTILCPLSVILSLFAAGAARGETMSCHIWTDVEYAIAKGYDPVLKVDIPNAGDTIRIRSGQSATLYLNGHEITTTHGIDDPLFKIMGGSLTIADGPDKTGGKIYGDNGYAPIIYVTDGGTFTLSGGTMAYEASTYSSAGLSAVYVENGRTVITGGTFKCSHPTADYSNGAAIWVASGQSAEINGGTFDGCSVGYAGGAIYSQGTLTVNGGTFSGCHSDSGSGGGAIYSEGGTLTVNGGTFSGCYASTSGGAIYATGKTTVNGGTFTSCSANNGSGGAILATDTTEVKGGTFSSCSASDYGGAIAAANGATVTAKGGLFKGNVAHKDGDTGDFSSVSVMGGVYYDWRSGWCPTASGFVEAKGTHYSVIGETGLTLDGDTIFSGTIAFDPQGETYKDLLLFDPARSTMTTTGDRWTINTDLDEQKCGTWDELKAALEAGKPAALTNDIEQTGAAATLSYNGSVWLHLSTFTLRRKAGTQLIVLNGADTTLTVKGAGTIDGTVDTLAPNGGCFSVTAGKLVLESGTLTGKATNGGAVAVEGSSAKFEMTGGTITGSSVSSSGGGVYVTSSGRFELSGGEISSCSASSYGGGIFLRSGTFLMTGGTIINCHSQSSGGGVELWSEGTISGGEISGCSTDCYGGALEVYDGSLTIEDGRFLRNTAGYGGVMRASSSSVSIRGGIYQDNTSNSGDFENSSSSISVVGGVFDNWTGSGCSVVSGSAAVKGYHYTFVGKDLQLDGSDVILNGTLTYDPQGENYADLHLIDTNETTVTQSGDTWVVRTVNPIVYTACSDWAQLRAALEAGDNAKVMNNIDQNGDLSTAYLNCGWSQTLNLNGFTLKRQTSLWLIVPNVAGNELIVKGGGTIDGLTNTLGEGGGCFHVAAGRLIIKDGTFKGQCSMYGGAIEVCSGAACEFRGGLITDSKATYGGGVYVHSGGTFTMTGGSIENCEANSHDGGGIYTDGTTTLSDCTISGNYAKYYGGGIYSYGGTISMTRVTVANNTAGSRAGGVGVTGATLMLDDCTVTNNSSSAEGGGLYIEGTSVEMKSGTISGNQVTDWDGSSWQYTGGGVYLANSSPSASFTLSGGTIEGNSGGRGGGVSVRSNASFVMTGGKICGNKSTGGSGGGFAGEKSCTITFSGGEISGNESCYNGGGGLTDGTFRMTGGVIKGNTAKSLGEAVYLNTTNTHEISAGVILGSVGDEVDCNPITGGIYNTDVSSMVKSSARWRQFDCNGMKVIAQYKDPSGNEFSTKVDSGVEKIYSGIFNFNVAQSIYSDNGVALDSSRFITQGSDGRWYVTPPPDIYVNGTLIDAGSGTGWELKDRIVTLSSPMDYTISGSSEGADIGFVVSANAKVELSSLNLTLGDDPVAAPFHFTSNVVSGTLSITNENKVYAMGGHSAFEIDAGASVSLAGDGSLVGSGETSGHRCFSVAGKLRMANGWSGQVTGYNTDQNGGAVAVGEGGTFIWTEGDITDCTGGKGGVLFNAGTAIVTNRVLNGNTGISAGGAIYSTGQIVIGCTRFENNEVTSGPGGALCIAAGTASIISSSFRKNEASNGGAIYADGEFFMLNATLTENKANMSGGGFYLNGGSGVLANVTVRANTSKEYGGGIYGAAGSLTLYNVLSQGGSGPKNSGSADLHSEGATVTAFGVFAPKANVLSTENNCHLNGGEGWSSIFKGNTGTLVAIGSSQQYVEPLYATVYNKAFDGYDASPWKRDITGRLFTECQIGSYWQTVDRPSLTVETLSDTADSSDGYVSLRDILEGIADGDENYTSLATNGVYKIAFLPTLAGSIKMSQMQYDIANAEGQVVEIDGGGMPAGRLTIEGYDITTTKSSKTVTTNSYRAFSVYPGNALRIRNLDFFWRVGYATKNDHGFETNDGGAIANRGTLEASDCTFTDCAAGPTFAKPSGFGGAIVNGATGVMGATATVSQCAFTGCRAAKGGAIYNYTGNSIAFADCSFESNRAGEGDSSVYVANGGAIFNQSDATLSYSGCSFTDNTMNLDGVQVPSDINDKVLNTPAVAVSVANGAMSVALCASAAPSLGAAAACDGAQALSGEEATEEPVIDMSGEKTMTDETGATVPAVAITPANVQPYLYYGLGRAESPGGEYKVSEWVQADADGSLPEALKAPKTGDAGFYRVEVSLGGK